MFEIKSMTYEESRRKYFEGQMQKAQRSMKYWEARIDRTRPNNLMDVAHGKAADAGWEYNFYKDALEALEDNKFQYETGFVRGFEAAQPKWISVEEKHPDAGEWVLTYCGGYAKWFDLNKWCGNCWLKTMPVTHWMPLPEPPKEDA